MAWRTNNHNLFISGRPHTNSYQVLSVFCWCCQFSESQGITKVITVHEEETWMSVHNVLAKHPVLWDISLTNVVWVWDPAFTWQAYFPQRHQRATGYNNTFSPWQLLSPRGIDVQKRRRETHGHNYTRVNSVNRRSPWAVGDPQRR